MRLRKAIVATLKSRRFWIWQLCGVIIYAIPVVIRILNFPGFWIWHFIPGNLLEKVLVNAFFPGGAGAITGEVFFSAYEGESVFGRKKYRFRLVGALGQTALWSAFQLWGYFLLIPGPGRGEGSNLFESIFVFPINFVLAALSIFTPDVVSFVKTGIVRLSQKSKRIV
jgi:hypothetical protein